MWQFIDWDLRMTGGETVEVDRPDWAGQKTALGRTCWKVKRVGSRITKAWIQLCAPYFLAI